MKERNGQRIGNRKWNNLCPLLHFLPGKNRLESALVHPDKVTRGTPAEKRISLTFRPERGALGMKMDKVPVIPRRIACRGKNAIYVAWV
jgi:hypothetical protein